MLYVVYLNKIVQKERNLKDTISFLHLHSLFPWGLLSFVIPWVSSAMGLVNHIQHLNHFRIGFSWWRKLILYQKEGTREEIDWRQVNKKHRQDIIRWLGSDIYINENLYNNDKMGNFLGKHKWSKTYSCLERISILIKNSKKNLKM